MKQTLALLPLMIAMGLAQAREQDAMQVIALADSATAVALEASAKAQADLAKSSKLTAAEQDKLRSELDAAQEQLGDLSRRIAELSMQLHDTSPRAFAFQYLNAPKRALVGVVFDSDDTGVKIIALTPNGPAAKAGIQVGDRLVSVNGTSVPKVAGGDPRMAVDAAREMFGELEDGQAVTMVVERAGKTMTFVPKAERREPAEWSQLFGGNVKLDALRDIQIHNLADLQALKEVGKFREMRVLDGMPETMAGIDGAEQRRIELVIQDRDGKGPGKHLEKLHIQDFNSLNLSSLNPELGKYFGTDRGILVLENDPDMFPNLKSGDVIQVIDGQPADSVTDVMRVIGKKNPGEVMNIEIFRNRQRQVISMEAPAGPRMLFRENLQLRDKALPTPPSPPAPGTPPAKPPMPIPPPKGVSA
ncbi:hypothetical protein C7S18_12005 [Ahniella affigens]|uniref:PDZ domain-containing protein n=1 Tax=Ahniella affigens TaxID=2021234 RepID=A0A2P1PSQ2_9GAMM|nr:PDZ domain-containing protein [Ahniella affigens]AVP97875.1 hypothetical protein C7S18_12005 [Ahniella affigens]